MKYLRIESFVYEYSENYLERDIRNILKEMSEKTRGFYADTFLHSYGFTRFRRPGPPPPFQYEFEFRRKRWERVNKPKPTSSKGAASQ